MPERTLVLIPDHWINREYIVGQSTIFIFPPFVLFPCSEKKLRGEKMIEYRKVLHLLVLKTSLLKP